MARGTVRTQGWQAGPALDLLFPFSDPQVEHFFRRSRIYVRAAHAQFDGRADGARLRHHESVALGDTHHHAHSSARKSYAISARAI